jgi:hypothetical protein
MLAWAPVAAVVVIVVAHFVVPWAILKMGRLRDPRDDKLE